MEAPRTTTLVLAKLAFALYLAAMHVAALSLDFTYSNNSLTNSTISGFTINFPFSLAVLHLDAALFCTAFVRAQCWKWLLLAPAILISGLTALVLMLSWNYPSIGWMEWLLRVTPSLQGQGALTTLLNLPLFAIFIRLIARGEKHNWKWIALFLILPTSIACCWLSSTTHDILITRSRAWWLERPWLVFSHVVLAATLSWAAVVISACMMISVRKWRHIALAASFLLLSSAMVAAIGISAMYFAMSRYRLSRPLWYFNENTWPFCYDFSPPLLTGAFTLFLLPFLLSANWSAEPGQNPFATSAAMRPALSVDERRHRFWRLTGLGLLLSALNLVAGLALHLLQVGRNIQFGEHGLFFEFMFLAPLGLWAAQTGASALFLQSNVWNVWKRSLVVLAWAELSILAFWGQIALSNSLQWMPSDYVGEVLHIVVGAMLLAAIGGLWSLFRGERVHCFELEVAATAPNQTKGLSISLGDIICLVTAAAALAYPFSVIFALERWASPTALFAHFLTTSIWPLAASAVSYCVLRNWLTDKETDLQSLALAMVCLLACSAFDYPALQILSTEFFFGVRSSLRFTALPALLIGVALTAIGLARCKFQVVQKASIPMPAPSPIPAPNPTDSTPLRPIIFLGAKPEPASTKAESPWD
jgi:hypothetical protein